MDSKTIQLIGNKKFEIELLELTDSGAYYVRWDRYGSSEEPFISEPMLDLNTAKTLFAEGLVHLEGH